MQESTWTGQNTLSEMLERIRATARVELVYGKGRKVGDKTLIPIAAVAYTFGAGAGGGTTPASNGSDGGGEAPMGGGGGGGGAVRVQPVGVLEVDGDETRLVPILDWTRIITTGLTAFGIWMVFRTIFRRR
ncbi:MAG: hypothetical protein J4N92_02700 [Chloroflexi bacterium]|nr:hypothetical protein [Chloroflexota bacterium]